MTRKTIPVSGRLLWSSASILLLVVLAGCGCDYLIAAEETRPVGDLKASVFTAACGLNVSVNTRVSIFPAGKRPRGKSNVFGVIFGDDGKRTSQGGPMVTATWVGNDTLLITYGKSATIRKQVHAFDGIVIRYQVEERW
jgi:hypothetical protein